MKRAGIYLLLTFLITWLLGIALLFNGGLESSFAPLIFDIVLLIPGGMVFVTRAVTKEGFKDPLLLPRFRQNWRYMLLAWLGTLAVVLLGFGAYFLVFSGQFDWQMTDAVNAYMEAYKDQGYTEDTIRQALYMQIVGVLYMPIFFNGLMCFCEELGFRGYLQTKLQEVYGLWQSVILTGIIWGIWYSPWIIMGYNYGTDYSLYPLGGCLAMIVYCVIVGIYLSWLKLKTNSIWPGAIASTMLNASATAYAYFMNTDDYNLFLGPCPTGLLGGLGFIAVAAVCMVQIRKMAR